MARRNRDEAAASAASEAGRILQQQKQAQETVEPAPQVKVERGERPPTRNEPRNRAMEEIYEADRQRKGIEEPKEEPKAAEPEPKAEETKAEPAAPAPDAGEVVAEVPAAVPETVRVKVDGEEWDAPKAEVEAAGGLVAYQKEKAAENRLAKLKEEMAETKKAQAALLQWAQQVQQQAQPQAAPKTPADILKEKIDVIRWGTPEESAAALQEVIATTNAPVDQNQLVRSALTAFQQTQAVTRFKTEFQDIVANPLLLKLATSLQNERIAELKGQVADWDNFYRSIGNEIRSVTGRQHQPSAAPATGNTSQSDKEAKKASIVSLPTAAARAELPKEEKPETRDEILNRMKKARGIPIG